MGVKWGLKFEVERNAANTYSINVGQLARHCMFNIIFDTNMHTILEQMPKRSLQYCTARPVHLWPATPSESALTRNLWYIVVLAPA
jgi:hypothetical protein